jgi:hypothetical protein
MRTMRNTISLVDKQLSESFSHPVEWVWISKKYLEWTAAFRIGTVTYLVSVYLVNSTMDKWEISFTAQTPDKDHGHQRAGTGNAWKVFGTVIAITRAFMEAKAPETIFIDNDDPKRFIVNKRLAEEAVAGSADYHLDIDEEDNAICIRKNETDVQ